jgi:uracil-DNA glycosylase
MTLEGWARQGVLLLNSCLTTEISLPGAHRGCGWDWFTDFVVSAVSMRRNRPTVYMLWGNDAQKKINKICTDKGMGLKNSEILTSTHPSPLSYNKGPINERFQGCRHFNKANVFLSRKGLERICWEKTGV